MELYRFLVMEFILDYENKSIELYRLKTNSVLKVVKFLKHLVNFIFENGPLDFGEN